MLKYAVFHHYSAPSCFQFMSNPFGINLSSNVSSTNAIPYSERASPIL